MNKALSFKDKERLHIALAKHQQEDWNGAKTVYQKLLKKVIQRKPKYIDANFNLALLYQEASS